MGLTTRFFENTSRTWREMHTGLRTYFFSLIPRQIPLQASSAKMVMEASTYNNISEMHE